MFITEKMVSRNLVDACFPGNVHDGARLPLGVATAGGFLMTGSAQTRSEAGGCILSRRPFFYNMGGVRGGEGSKVTGNAFAMDVLVREKI